jgi:hypothetical protein
MNCETNLRKLLPGLLACGMAVQAQAEGETASSFGEVFAKGKVGLDFRYRYENVEQDGFKRSAAANTLRSRLTLATATWAGLSALAEVDNVWDFDSDNYNSTENGNTQYPVIADPTGTNLNQVWLKYAHQGWDGTIGRQRINHGNQRFVGGVAWRQNEQTYDSFRATWKPIEILNLDFSYAWQVKRIFGPDDGANPADFDGDNFFLRADYNITPDHRISAYGYWLDFDEDPPYSAAQTVNLSSDTYGLEYAGKLGILSLAAAWATQSEAGDSELKYDADYYMGELGVTVGPAVLKAGYEVLGSDNGVGFQTPLATLHKFQGWADQFLTTPGDGVEDAYGSIGFNAGPVKLAVIYHEFQAEDSSEDFGNEWDAIATWPVTDNFTAELKYANFGSDSKRDPVTGNRRFVDVEKAWITLQFKY